MNPIYILQLHRRIDETGFLEAFTYFPHEYRCGALKMDKEEVDHLKAEGYIKECKRDVYGPCLSLTDKAKQLLKKQVGI